MKKSKFSYSTSKHFRKVILSGCQQNVYVCIQPQIQPSAMYINNNAPPVTQVNGKLQTLPFSKSIASGIVGSNNDGNQSKFVAASCIPQRKRDNKFQFPGIRKKRRIHNENHSYSLRKQQKVVCQDVSVKIERLAICERSMVDGSLEDRARSSLIANDDDDHYNEKNTAKDLANVSEGTSLGNMATQQANMTTKTQSKSIASSSGVVGSSNCGNQSKLVAASCVPQRKRGINLQFPGIRKRRRIEKENHSYSLRKRRYVDYVSVKIESLVICERSMVNGSLEDRERSCQIDDDDDHNEKNTSKDLANVSEGTSLGNMAESDDFTLNACDEIISNKVVSCIQVKSNVQDMCIISNESCGSNNNVDEIKVIHVDLSGILEDRNSEDEDVCSESKDVDDCSESKDEDDCSELKDLGVCSELKDLGVCSELKDLGVCSESKDEGVCSESKGKCVCSESKDEGVCSELKDKCVCSESMDEGVCNESKDKCVCSESKDEGVCNESKDKCVCSESKDEGVCNESKDKCDCSASNDEGVCSESNEGVCSESKDESACSESNDEGVCSESKDEGVCSESKDEGVCSESNDGVCSESKDESVCSESKDESVCSESRDEGVCSESQRKRENKFQFPEVRKRKRIEKENHSYSLRKRRYVDYVSVNIERLVICKRSTAKGSLEDRARSCQIVNDNDNHYNEKNTAKVLAIVSEGTSLGNMAESDDFTLNACDEIINNKVVSCIQVKSNVQDMCIISNESHGSNNNVDEIKVIHVDLSGIPEDRNTMDEDVCSESKDEGVCSESKDEGDGRESNKVMDNENDETTVSNDRDIETCQTVNGTDSWNIKESCSLQEILSVKNVSLEEVGVNAQKRTNKGESLKRKLFQRKCLRYLKSHKRSLRVLSLFDGVGTGLVCLKELGIAVDAYYAAEVDCNAVLVASMNHPDIRHLGDVWAITRDKLAEICPIDLVLGGPPCNDLSIVNPARKGFNGTGILVVKFLDILTEVETLSKGKNHVFWLLENTGSMLAQYKQTMCQISKCEPTVWDASYFTGQRRARNFWGNLPGLENPPEMREELAKDKKDLNAALIANSNRTAKVTHSRTITTSNNSYTVTNGISNGLVSMDGKDDAIWLQELERLFGFPDHYTDVGSLPVDVRRKLIGKAWSVPVIKHLLSPLIEYFSLASDLPLD